MRVQRFLDFVASRPEKEILVVSHSSFLARMFQVTLSSDLLMMLMLSLLLLDDVQEHFKWEEREGKARFENAELRSVVIPFR